MKCGIPSDVIHKEVVIIGNGPSGIALSYMLSGNLPFIRSNYHPDEMLSARLKPLIGECLVEQDLEQLADGLEGRSTNYISVLMDALLRPCADMGLEMEPLIEFKKAGNKIDHIVLGKGPPGGTWHKMDPYILTLSLGSWMALPGLPFNCRDSCEKRAYALNVAKYYESYVQYHNLSKHFKNYVEVTNVAQTGSASLERCVSEKSIRSTRLKDERNERLSVCLDADIPEERTTCFISNALNCLLSKAHRKKNRCCKRPLNTDKEHSPYGKVREIDSSDAMPVNGHCRRDKTRSVSLCCDTNSSCDNVCSRSFTDTFKYNTLRNSYSLDFSKPKVPLMTSYSVTKTEDSWLVNTEESKTGKRVTYSCKYLVLANGSSDLPNKLEISEGDTDPEWLVHDLRTLEDELENLVSAKSKEPVPPVVIVGAGLSAADAVIAIRARNVPVIHVFRSKSSDLNKQLPENLYPEYHKVRQMMKDGGSTYPLYTAYPEYNLTGLDESTRTVTLTSKDGKREHLQVSFAAVLIGARPDLSFLPEHKHVGVNKEIPVDCKINTIDINKTTHKVNGFKNLFALGPLAGDNFVRFIPGGALAVVSELYRQNKYLS
ncbi:oxidative stress-induced growth inhibitor 1 [Aethina tumida]|uniref:oxidative stress-induced growth inhibitor 1 n=1 Tax=Aethina tumida TaxID=116153 RepID=UPI00096B6738|nr:oxidative stress-induced growth inhibitor 1 [Aethina tumida]XP_019881752.1 oxidative stress-induced growth inhibitor 1 [Aethina tumida]XP_049817815.1 oxidative stress-induced growth inhibitor 1 [Aethina tumida]